LEQTIKPSEYEIQRSFQVGRRNRKSIMPAVFTVHKELGPGLLEKVYEVWMRMN